MSYPETITVSVPAFYWGLFFAAMAGGALFGTIMYWAGKKDGRREAIADAKAIVESELRWNPPGSRR